MLMDDFNIEDMIEEDFDITTEAKFEYFINILKQEADREKTMIMLPDAMKRIISVTSAIKSLLKTDGYNFTMTTKRYDTFPQDLTIIVETEVFDVRLDDYWIYKDIINKVDDYSAEGIPECKVRFYFGLKDIYTEIK